MDNSKTYKIVIGVLFLFYFLLTNACNWDLPEDEETCLDYDYSNCNTERPVFGEIGLRLNDELPGSGIEIRLYRGYFEDNSIELVDTVFESYVVLTVPVDISYTAAAVYKTDSTNIVAIDYGMVKRTSEKVCDSICWSLNEPELDLRLR